MATRRSPIFIPPALLQTATRHRSLGPVTHRRPACWQRSDVFNCLVVRALAWGSSCLSHGRHRLAAGETACRGTSRGGSALARYGLGRGTDFSDRATAFV